MVLEHLLYTESHEWLNVEDDIAVMGITDYAQHELGDIVYVELPEVGDELTKGEALGSVEAVKAVEDIISPVSGEVLEVNEALEDAPETINKSAFEEGWIVKIKLSDPTELDALLKANDYAELIEE
ncbi:MAG: glycine cleavage system protein GcvH [Candidatus Cloacimonetes bacterium]|nr:glycine cleavage system protein GcvH [Candidatus Cloacimonadota bacterium]MBL7149639.1 glycine cleavage system protein GcvH [Candidatus Cloacimonadota bacterium]